MRTVVIDTETSDISPGQICQLSYLVIDDNDIQARNYYFEVDYINPYASAVNGFTVEILKVKSDGNKFNNCHNKILKDFEGTDLFICHNVAFDKKFLAAEFKRCGREFNIEQTFCTMKNYTDICKLSFNNKYTGKAKYKWPKLNEVTKFLNISDQEIISKARKLYSGTINGEHDSRFDSVATLLCYEAGIKIGYFKNPNYSCTLLEYPKMNTLYIPKTYVLENKSTKINITPVADPFNKFLKDTSITNGIKELIKYWNSPKEGTIDDLRIRLEEIERVINSEKPEITKRCLDKLKIKYPHYYSLNVHYLNQLEDKINKQEKFTNPQMVSSMNNSYNDINKNTTIMKKNILYAMSQINNKEKNKGNVYLFISIFLVIIMILIIACTE